VDGDVVLLELLPPHAAPRSASSKTEGAKALIV
jgi:hypothetical protein